MNAHFIAIKAPFDLQHTFMIITMFKVQGSGLLKDAVKLMFQIISSFVIMKLLHSEALKCRCLASSVCGESLAMILLVIASN